MIFFTSCEETTVTSEVFLMDSFMVQTIHGADGEKIAKQAEEVVKNLEEQFKEHFQKIFNKHFEEVLKKSKKKNYGEVKP